MRTLEGRPGTLGQLPPLGREQVLQNRLAGERVAELEAVAVGVDQLFANRVAHGGQDSALIHPGDAGKQLPLESPAEQCSCPQHRSRRGVERVETWLQRCGEVERNGRPQRPGDRPGPLIEGQQASGDETREQLLDQEQVALAVDRDARDGIRRRRVGVEARGNRVPNPVLAQWLECEHGDVRVTPPPRQAKVQGDPVPTAASAGKGYLYRAGDATKTYNSAVLGTRDVKEASRAVMWLQPDHIVIFDRAETGEDGRFKRFWLQTPSLASISGATATARTRGGQRLFVTTLLPDDAAMTSEPAPAEVGGGYDAGPATGEPMKFRLRIEAPGGPRRTHFLNVLQGADGGARPDAPAVVHSSGGTPYTGALVAGTLVLFPDASGGTVATTTVDLPAGTNRVLVTGLRPDPGYAVTRDGGRLTVRAGGPAKTDAGGVLDVKE